MPENLAHGGGPVHVRCLEAWNAERAAERAAPKTKMEQQLDRIETKIDALRVMFDAIFTKSVEKPAGKIRPVSDFERLADGDSR